MPASVHRPKVARCVQHVMDKGHDKGSAIPICQASIGESYRIPQAERQLKRKGGKALKALRKEQAETKAAKLRARRDKMGWNELMQVLNGGEFFSSCQRDAKGHCTSGSGGGSKGIPTAVGGRGLLIDDQVEFHSGTFTGKVGTITGQHAFETKGQYRATHDNPSYRVSIKGAGPGGKDYETTIDHKTLTRSASYAGKKAYEAPKSAAPTIEKSKLGKRDFAKAVKDKAYEAGLSDLVVKKAILPASEHVRDHQGATTEEIAAAIGDKPDRLGRALDRVPRNLLQGHEGRWYLGKDLIGNKMGWNVAELVETLNGFCPTGKGGGRDNSCHGAGGKLGSKADERRRKLRRLWERAKATVRTAVSPSSSSEPSRVSIGGWGGRAHRLMVNDLIEILNS